MISAPYNFVPLSHKVYYPDWASQVSQDVPFSDGEDGIIDLEINNVTPLFVRNGHNRNDNKTNYSSHVIDNNGKRKYYIPGATIKGCTRSILEILSFSKLGFYNDDSFGIQREFDTKKSTNSAYLELMKNVSCGWLQRDNAGNFHIDICKNGVQTISHKMLSKRFPNFYKGEDHKTAQCKQESLNGDKDIYPLIIVDEEDIHGVPAGRYRVVCTGYMNGKEHEYLFSEDDSKRQDVDPKVFNSFDTIHKKTEYYAGHGENPGFLRKRLFNGDPIPVFFTIDKQKEINAMGITRMFRYPFKYSIKEQVASSRQEKYDSQDMAEVMFGYTKGVEALKGRIQFSHAFCDENIKDTELVSIAGVLGSPSASYYPLYLRQNNAPYKNYNDNSEIAGRKRYRIANGESTIQLPQGNDNENVTAQYLLIPAGKKFHCRIVVHNLRKVEIGALLASLTFSHTSGCYHNLGLAKSFGYGKLRFQTTLNGFQYNEEEYLKAYEFEMLHNEINITTEPSICSLISIASEHDTSKMRMMKLSEYTDNKSNENFSKLEEQYKSIKSYLTQTDILEYTKKVELEREQAQKIRQEKEDADKNKERYLQENMEKLRICRLQLDAGQWKEALDAINYEITSALQLNMPTQEWQEMKDICTQKIESDLNSKQNQSLAESLYGKNSAGNVIGTTAKWKKSIGRDFIESDLKELKDAFDTLTTKEQKAFIAKQKELIKAIGLEWAERFIKELSK